MKAILDMMKKDTDEYLKNLNSFFGFTNLFNVTGQPSMSVPLYWTEENLPVGLQFSTRYTPLSLFRRNRFSVGRMSRFGSSDSLPSGFHSGCHGS